MSAVSSSQAKLVAQSVYLPTPIAGIAGWVRYHDLPVAQRELLPMENGIILPTYTFGSLGAQRNWEWVNAGRLLDITGDDSVEALLKRFLILSKYGEQLKVDVFQTSSPKHVQTIRLHVTLKQQKFYRAEREFIIKDNSLLIPFPFAADIVHAVKTAEAQGVKNTEVEISAAWEPVDEAGGNWWVTYVMNGKKRLETQPVFKYLKLS